MWRIGWAPNSIPIYISNKLQRYTVYLHLETALHVSGGTSTHRQEGIQLYLQHLVFVTPLLLTAAIVEELELVWVCCGCNRQPQTNVKPETAVTDFEFMMMDGVSLKPCWAIKEQWNDKCYYTFASCWFFLWDLYYDARIHEYDILF
jgi:hypothetical protein